MATGKDNKEASVKVTSSKTLFTGRVFSLNRDHIFEPGGLEAVREVIVPPGSVVVLPEIPACRLLLGLRGSWAPTSPAPQPIPDARPPGPLAQRARPRWAPSAGE